MENTYLDAASGSQKRALAWVPRVSGFFSLCGACAILLHVDRQRRKKRTVTVYSELVFNMSVFDIFSSGCWILSTWPIEASSKVFGARGNAETCTAQGFFFQFGYVGSVTYNLTLSIYYLLVITYNRREHHLRKNRSFFHGPPIGLATIMALAGLPFYDNAFYLCSVPQSPAEGARWVEVIIFSILPVTIVFVVASLAMFKIYSTVRARTRASLRWSMATQARGDRKLTLTPTQLMERAVLRQALFYVGAFFVAWPVYIFGQIKGDSSFALWIMVVLLTPLQGFMNCLVYFRPRWEAYRARKRIERAKAAAECKDETHEVSENDEDELVDPIVRLDSVREPSARRAGDAPGSFNANESSH